MTEFSRYIKVIFWFFIVVGNDSYFLNIFSFYILWANNIENQEISDNFETVDDLNVGDIKNFEIIETEFVLEQEIKNPKWEKV